MKETEKPGKESALAKDDNDHLITKFNYGQKLPGK